MRRMWKIAILLAVVAALSIAIVSTAAAQEDDPETPWPAAGGRGVGLLWGGRWDVFDAVADALGLTPVQLFSELHGGKTLEQVADAHGVDFEAVQEVIQAKRQDQRRARIEQAVQDGKLTREQADWMLEGLELGFGRLGRGLRNGPGGLAPTQP